MNGKIILSADSTCDLSSELKEKYNVHFVPYHIIVDGEERIDNVDVKVEEIFGIYDKKGILPKTAAINVDDYIKTFKKWTDEGYEVIHICLGSALTTAYNNCRLAAEELKGLYPVDSCNLSTGTGHLVIEAAKRIAAGMPAPEIVKELDVIKRNIHSSFILDTLEYMHAGGRCSAIVKLGANILKLKPCIEVNNADGSMGLGKKYRGELDSVLVKYTKDKLSEYENISDERIFITYSSIEEKYVGLVKKAIEETMSFKNIYVTNASCTISSHCGPRTLGILFMTDEEGKNE